MKNNVAGICVCCYVPYAKSEQSLESFCKVVKILGRGGMVVRWRHSFKLCSFVVEN